MKTMRTRTIRILAAAAAWSLAASMAFAETPADFAMRQPLATTGDKAFYRIVVPDSVYDGATRPDLGDMRVFNGDGAAIPFAFVPPPAPATAGSPRRPLALFPLTVDTTRPEAADLSIKLRSDPSGTKVDIRARDGTPVGGSRVVGYLIDASPHDKPLVALVLPLADAGSVNARLRVDASEDLDRWHTVVASAPLLSLEHNGRRLTRDRVELPPQRSRYLRITWLTPSPPALASAMGDIADRIIDLPRRSRNATGLPDRGNPDAFVFDLGAALPVDRVTLELPEVNTVAPVTWEARTHAQDSWRSAGSSVVYRLRQEDGEVVNAGHAIAAAPARFFRISVDPKAGGVGATVPTLVAGWHPQEIVFAARGNAPFELAYGSRRIGPGALPIATLVPGYTADKPLPANVGVARLTQPPSSANRAALREPLDFKRWLLWGSLVAASLLLGYMGLRLAQQMRGVPADARSEGPDAPTNGPPPNSPSDGQA